MWQLEIDFRRRNKLKEIYNGYSLKFSLSSVDLCKDKAEELNKKWNTNS